MNKAIKRFIFAACVLGVAELAIAAAAIPIATVDKDPKNSRVAKVVVNSPEGDTSNYDCEFDWDITFTGGAETTDYCQVKVPAGSKDLAICTKKYDTRISLIVMTQQKCKPSP